MTAEKLSFGLFTHNFSFFNLQTQLESNNSKKKILSGDWYNNAYIYDLWGLIPNCNCFQGDTDANLFTVSLRRID